MRSLPDTEHQEFDRSLSDVFKDFVVRPADGHIGSWIAEFFGTLRHECVKGIEEASLKIGEIDLDARLRLPESH